MLAKQSVNRSVDCPSGSDDDRKLVIAQIIGGLNVGGAERHFVNLINEMSESDCIAVFLGHKRSVTSQTLYGQLSGQILQTHNLIRKRSSLLGIWALTRELLKHRCNVVHTHMFWASLYGAIAAHIAGVPVIVTTEHGENRWKKAYHRWLERHIISKIVDMRYCVSMEILVRRRDVDGVPADKLQLMANGTIIPDDPARLWNNEEPIIGTVGRFVRQKDFELFVDIIAILRDRGYAVRGCIVGDGPEMKRIRQKISDLGLESVIELPGLVTETDKWFRYFDIYAVTSSEEGLPISLLEAMSYGLPVVASNVGAISTAIRSCEEGAIVPAGNKDRFVNAIINYLDNRELAVRTGRNARERVTKNFSIEAISAKYAADYQVILRRKAG